MSGFVHVFGVLLKKRVVENNIVFEDIQDGFFAVVKAKQSPEPRIAFLGDDQRRRRADLALGAKDRQTLLQPSQNDPVIDEIVLFEHLRREEQIEPIAAEISEEPGSKAGIAVDISPETNTISPVKNMALRLKVGEVAIAKTEFGIYIVQRIE